MYKKNMVSLYQYLKRPAGGELGRKVALEAMRLNVPIEERKIETRTYQGVVMTYPKEFLDQYFKKPGLVRE